MPANPDFYSRFWRLTAGLLLTLSLPLSAQTDSVTISGQIRHLTPRLYRESPTVIITSTNVLQAGQEQTHSGPLQPDGSFRVTVPLIYPQEEMYFNAARVGTAFLASAGTLTINLDADSLFIAAVPFRFGGVNAQVNGQFAQYKAYEARTKSKVDAAAISQRIGTRTDRAAFAYLMDSFIRTLRDFSATRAVYPLLTRWLTAIARYDAASFLYDHAAETNRMIETALADSLRPATDRLLTPSRATAVSRFSNYASGRVGITPERAISVKQLANLLSRYGQNLSVTEQDRLTAIRQKGGATGTDMRFLNTLLGRNEMIKRLLLFDVSMQQARTEFDSLSVDYLEGAALAASMTTTPINELSLLRTHVRGMIGDPFVLRSVDDVYQRQTKDSVAIREAGRRLSAGDSLSGSVEVGTGIFATRNSRAGAGQLISRVLRNNPGRVVYLIRWAPGNPQSQALVQAAQRLRDTFSNRDLTLLYVTDPGVDPSVWLESVIRQGLKGEHLYLSDTQWNVTDLTPLPPYDAAVYLFGPTGKPQRKNAELPAEYNKLVDQIQKLLDGK